jgi:hypothetical protein
MYRNMSPEDKGTAIIFFLAWDSIPVTPSMETGLLGGYTSDLGLAQLYRVVYQ